jgi:hypothetical protein
MPSNVNKEILVMLRVIGIYNASQHPSLVQTDGYVPVRFRTQATPLGGARYIRMGNFENSLLEIIVPTDAIILRGLTVTLVGALGQGIMSGMAEASNGLPVLELPRGSNFSGPESSQYINLNYDFSLSVSDNIIEVRFDGSNEFDGCIAHGNVWFLTMKDELVGIRFVDLDEKSIGIFSSYAPK